MSTLDERAALAKNKKAALGEDIDLDAFSVDSTGLDYIEDLTSLPEADNKRLLLSGVDVYEKERAGTYV